jgi:hypothetical protein
LLGQQSRIGLLGQLREPPGSIYSRAKPSFALARVPLKHGWHTRVAPSRTAVFGCIEAPPSSSRLIAAFAPQLLLPTCRAISASPPSRGSRELTVCGSSKLIASGRHLHTSSLCTLSPCMVILLLPVAGLVLASALPRRRSLHDRPCHGTAVRDLVALRASRSQAATPHLHTRTPVRVLGPHRAAAHASESALLAPGCLPPLGSRSCARTLTPSAPRTPSRCRTALCSHFCLPYVCSCFQRAFCFSLCVGAATARSNACSCPRCSLPRPVPLPQATPVPPPTAPAGPRAVA